MGFQTAAVAQEIGRRIEQPMRIIKRKNAELGDQIMRATISLVLNVNEAARRIGKDRTNRFRIASGSAKEIQGAIELALSWHFVTQEGVADLMSLLDRVLAMLWRLEHPKRLS